MTVTTVIAFVLGLGVAWIIGWWRVNRFFSHRGICDLMITMELNGSKPDQLRWSSQADRTSALVEYLLWSPKWMRNGINCSRLAVNRMFDGLPKQELEYFEHRLEEESKPR